MQFNPRYFICKVIATIPLLPLSPLYSKGEGVGGEGRAVDETHLLASPFVDQ